MHYRPARWTIRVPVVLHVDDGDIDALTQSVSSTGLRIEGLFSLTRETNVKISAPGAEFDAKVVWAGGRRAGLEFDVPQSRKALIDAGLRHP